MSGLSSRRDFKILTLLVIVPIREKWNFGLGRKKINHYLSFLNLALLRQEEGPREGTGDPDRRLPFRCHRKGLNPRAGPELTDMASSASFTSAFCLLIFQVSDMRYKAVRTENTHLKGMMGDLDPARYLVMR